MTNHPIYALIAVALWTGRNLLDAGFKTEVISAHEEIMGRRMRFEYTAAHAPDGYLLAEHTGRGTMRLYNPRNLDEMHVLNEILELYGAVTEGWAKKNRFFIDEFVDDKGWHHLEPETDHVEFRDDGSYSIYQARFA